MYIIKMRKASGVLVGTSIAVYTKKATAELVVESMKKYADDIDKDCIYEIVEIQVIDW